MKITDLFINRKSIYPNWGYIETIKEFSDLKDCPQSLIWHKEGNAFAHTVLVTNGMIDAVEDKEFHYAQLMVAAAICHDLGKPSTTKFDKEKKDYTTKYHAQEGSHICRRLFFDEEFFLRELLCWFVEKHMVLHHINDEIENKEKTYKKYIKLSLSFKEPITCGGCYNAKPSLNLAEIATIENLAILNRCDSEGSINDYEDKAFLDKKYDDIKNIADMLGVWNHHKIFRNGYAKYNYLLNDNQPINTVNNNSMIGSDIYIMVGISGSGKNTWIENHMPNIPTISRDDIRKELGIIKGDEKHNGTQEQELKVTEIANERIVNYCKEGKSFIINDMNLYSKYRNEFKSLVMDYNPNYIYVYVEAPSIEENYKRRYTQMSDLVLNRMFDRLCFPHFDEYDDIIYVKQIN